MTLPAQVSPRVAALLAKTRAARARLIFGIDATASRESTWDLATSLQAGMFEEAARIGGLDVQLLHYRGCDEIQASPWTSDANELASRMSRIRCAAGATQIARMIQQIRTENACEKIAAVTFVGDAIEEPPRELYAAAADLGVPIFMFQEGDAEVVYLTPRGEIAPTHQKVSEVFRELARLTGGAYGKFDSGAAKQLGELLRAVAAFAVGGMTALANQHTESARKLLGQLK
jgi:hypothetical protein